LVPIHTKLKQVKKTSLHNEDSNWPVPRRGMLWRGCRSWVVTITSHQEVGHALHLATVALDSGGGRDEIEVWQSKENQTNDTTNIVKIPYEKMNMFFIN
jgi:hypothetical protein